MVFVRFDPTGNRRVTDLTNLFYNSFCFLVGAAPSLKYNNLSLLNDRHVLSMAINNAALHFKPTMWCGCDNPICHAPEIITDPSIMKFSPIDTADSIIHIAGEEIVFKTVPNLYFFFLKPNVLWSDVFKFSKEVPWFRNTLFTSIIILYNLGIRNIILLGCDFDFEDNPYAHDVNLSEYEKNWNRELYKYQKEELISLSNIFNEAGLTIYDATINSKLKDVYKSISLEEGIKLCKRYNVTTDTRSLVHCSRLLTQDKTQYIEPTRSNQNKNLITII